MLKASVRERSQAVAKRSKGAIPGPPPVRRPELDVLRDVDDALGLVLWQTVRHVHDWAETPPERRATLFNPRPSPETRERRAYALAQAPELAEPLGVFAAMAASPRLVGPARLAEACHQVSEWAQARGLWETGVQFAEAAAAVQPRAARRARLAARVSRTMGLAERAELWYQRAIALARRQERWKEYVRAHLGLGRLHATRGEAELARRHYHSAARAAWSSSGEKWLAAQTQHDMLALAAEQGDFAAAEEHARKALEWYPRHHLRFPAAVHDFAFLLVRQHLYSVALPLLERVVDAPIPPHDQVIGWSTLARAAACAGDAERFRTAERRVLGLAPLYDLFAAAAWVNLAFGARALGRWDEALAYARTGVEAARAKEQREVEVVGTGLLAELEARRPAPPEAPPRAGDEGHALRELARTLAAQLTAWRGPTWTRKRQSGPESLGQV